MKTVLALVAIAFLTSCRTAPTADTVPAARRELAPLQLINEFPCRVSPAALITSPRTPNAGC
jgi:hypothetical protein